MMLALNKRKPYKVYVKKLENGFGLKTVNTSTGVENVFVVTSEAIGQANTVNNLQLTSSKQILRPIMTKFSQDNVRSSESVTPLNDNSIAINKVLSHLEPYLRELKSEILGFHIFQEDNILPSENVQKTSIIFVTNTKMAKEKGVHINIPGKLMHTFCINAKENNEKLVIEADPVVKPFTIVIGDYVLHINICFDLPPILTSRTTATQTRKLYSLKSSVDNDAGMVYNIEPLFDIPLTNQAQDKETQTEKSTLLIQSTQTNFNLFAQDGATQTESVILYNCGTSTTELNELEETTTDFSSFYRNNFGSDEDDFQTFESLVINRSLPDNQQDSQSTFKTFESHTHFVTCANDLEAFNSHRKMKHTFSSHIKNISDNTKANILTQTTGSENYKVTSPTISSPEDSTFTIFKNSSKFKFEPSSSNLSQNIGSVSNFNAPDCRSSTKLATFEKGKVPLNTIKQNKSFNGTKKEQKYKSSDNVSVKEIKQHLNEATLSLNQLYSVVELLEELSTEPGFQEIREEGTMTTNLDIVESIPIQSENITKNSAAVKVDTPFKSSLCDRCGSFYSVTIPEEHNCDEYTIGQQTNLKTKIIEPDNKFEKDHIKFQESEHENQRNTYDSEKLLTNSDKKNCNSVHCLQKTVQSNTGVHIIVLKEFSSEDHRPESHDTLMEVNIKTNDRNKENHERNYTDAGAISDKSSNSQKNSRNSYNQDKNNERVLCDNEKMNKYHNGIEEIIRIVSLKGEENNTVESCGSIENSLNSDRSKRNSKFVASTLLQQTFTNKSDLTNAIPPNRKRKLFQFQGRRQDKSLTGFKTCTKAFTSCNKLKFEEIMTPSEHYPCTKEDKCLVTNCEEPSSTDTRLITSKHQYLSDTNTSTTTLHIIPSSFELLQKPSNFKPVFELRSMSAHQDSEINLGYEERLEGKTTKSGEFGTSRVSMQGISGEDLARDVQQEKQDSSQEYTKRLYNTSINSDVEINTKKKKLKKKSLRQIFCFPI